MEENAVINALNINKSFGSFHALKDLSIKVGQGEIFGFIGRNGAGKTTFMRIVCALMKPDNGTIEIRKLKMGFLPQNVRFHDNMDADRMIAFFAKLKGIGTVESMKLAGELEIDLKKSVKALSPGQQRKLQMVISTIGSPELLVLDEPTAGLDPMGVQQVREIIRVLNKKGCTVFISSHVLLELENLCSSVAIIEKGQICYQGRYNTSYEIELEGEIRRLPELLPIAETGKYSIVGDRLLAEVERHEVPELLKRLQGSGFKVFGVKRQGLESLYNSLLGEGA